MRMIPCPWPSTRIGAALLFVTALAGCDRTAADPNNREVPWKYGPLSSSSSAEHFGGAGGKGAPIVQGWQCQLLNQKQLVIHPFQPAAAHPLHDKVALSVMLYQGDTLLAEKEAGVVRPGNAPFTLDVDPAVGAKLDNLIFFYVKP